MIKMRLLGIAFLASLVLIPLYANKKYVESQNSTETKSAEGCGCGNGVIEVN
tara:strand:- start:21709 stop:21864 length:156 start_codon:yes stop_codon:yes gene_type:complete